MSQSREHHMKIFPQSEKVELSSEVEIAVEITQTLPLLLKEHNKAFYNITTIKLLLMAVILSARHMKSPV